MSENQSDKSWKEKLTPEEYRILRGRGTEAAFSGEYWDSKAKGTYKCRGCGEPLFSSDTKFDSGSGWPSYSAPIDESDGSGVREVHDDSHGMVRTEVTCAKCDSHLGHLFPDGPAPTGQRYCINSASLTLDETEE